MREPTKQEISKFKRACKALNELGKEGFSIYLSNDTMNLMIKSSHDDSGQAQQEHIRASENICGAGGGDW